MSDINTLIEKIKDGDYHIGNLLIDRLKKWNPEELGTIDAGTGETETYGSMLKRIVHLARCMQALGLQPGDVLALAGNNHIHLRIPYFAAMVIGLPVVGVDPLFKYEELKHLFKQTRPKIAFCEVDTYELYSRVAEDLGLGTKIVTFYGDDTNMSKFMASCEETPIDYFKPPTYDTNKVYAWLVSTSGTTGAAKQAAITHYVAAKKTVEMMQMSKVQGEHNKAMNISPTQWLSGNAMTLGYILMNWTIVQSSKPNSFDHIIDIINEYKPAVVLCGPSLLSLMFRSDKKIDMSCFNCVVSGGAKIYLEMMTELKRRMHKDAEVIEVYGQTESGGILTRGEHNAPIGSCGRASSLLEMKELKHLFKQTRPKIAFCEVDTYELYSRVAEDLGLGTKIVTFYGDDTNMSKFMASCEETPIDYFKPPTYDTNKVYAWLVSTSGTTGAAKQAAITHYVAAKKTVEMMQMSKVQGEHNKAMNISPTQWLSGNAMTLGYILMNWTIVQSSKPNSFDHIIDIINEYKPAVVLCGPSLLSLMFRSDKKIDMSCFNCVVSGGAKIYLEMMTELKRRMHKDAEVIEVYGQTESGGILTRGEHNAPIGSCGRASSLLEMKLVDPETGKEITEPNKPGEMWAKGLIFTEYYNNPEETAKALTEDGWFKTGDLLYRDENGYYYFVERIKMLIKYRSYHIVPPELEEIISELPGVKEVCVTSIPHVVDGQHAVACVVKQPGSNVTAQEIKDIIAERLSDSKQLRGGVVFMDELPKTSTTKVARNKVQEYVKTASRE